MLQVITTQVTCGVSYYASAKVSRLARGPKYKKHQFLELLTFGLLNTAHQGPSRPQARMNHDAYLRSLNGQNTIVLEQRISGYLFVTTLTSQLPTLKSIRRPRINYMNHT